MGECVLNTSAEEIRKSLALPTVSVRLFSNTFTNAQFNQNGKKEE